MEFKFLLPITVLFLLTPLSGEVTHNLGVTGGFPQMVALTYQAEVAPYLALEGYAGSLALLNTTLGARAVLTPTGSGVKPRGFAGVCLVDQYYTSKYGDPSGTETYFWAGAGLGFEFPCGFQLFGDLVYIGEGDFDKGLGYSKALTFSAGLLFRL